MQSFRFVRRNYRGNFPSCRKVAVVTMKLKSKLKKVARDLAKF